MCVSPKVLVWVGGLCERLDKRHFHFFTFLGGNSGIFFVKIFFTFVGGKLQKCGQ